MIRDLCLFVGIAVLALGLITAARCTTASQPIPVVRCDANFTQCKVR